MKAEDFFLPVSTYLSDQLKGDEYARWTQQDLFFAFKWAVRWLAGARPQFFAKKFSVSLQEGAWQQLPPDCVYLADTLNNLRKITHRSMQLVDAERNRVWVGLSKETYRPREYAYDSDQDPNSFYIYPPVPAYAAGKKLEFIGRYNPNPQTPTDDLVVNPTMDGVVESLMIYYIGTGENESATLKTVAGMRMADVKDALGMTTAEMRRLSAEATAEEARERN